MIPTGFDDFIVCCTMGSLAALAVLWGRLAWRRRAQDWSLSREEVYQCRNCQVVFIAKRIERAARCPACGEWARYRNRTSSRRVI